MVLQVGNKKKNKLMLKRAEEMKKLIYKIKLDGSLFDEGCGEGFITDVIFRNLGKNYLRYWEVNREFKKRFSLLAKKIVGTSMLRTLAKILINHPHYAKYLLLGQKVNRA